MNTRWPPRVDRLTPALPMNPLIFNPTASPGAPSMAISSGRRRLAFEIADAVEQSPRRAEAGTRCAHPGRKNEPHRRMRQREQVEPVLDVRRLRGLPSAKTSAARAGYRTATAPRCWCPVRHRNRARSPPSASVHEDLGSRQRPRLARGEPEPRHAGDARQRLTAKPQRRNRGEVRAGANFTRRMPSPGRAARRPGPCRSRRPRHARARCRPVGWRLRRTARLRVERCSPRVP